MEKPNPATPAQAAAPGSVPAVKTQPSSSTVPATNNGNQGNEEGKVTITTKEYGELQRAKARSLSFDKRMALNTSRNNPVRSMNGAAATPEAEAVANAEDRAAQAERRALQSEVRDNVRDILAKPEYASLPASTKDLILKNPSMLSTADNLEEALLDIEDFINEQVSNMGSEGGIPVTVKTEGSATRPGPANTETPPTSASGSAAPDGGVMEDTSKLTGSARSRAILRNSIRAKKSGL